ncbi:TPA: short chain dehydrogenase [Candidatus Latescibacteria bacterium]|nr:short chain dehydrogenase [Candidatus Latescibacterota bacterium]|tara:strand:- start:165 stop:944 length:780 start_codon:yes stop_codon:yes gene_type:complete
MRLEGRAALIAGGAGSMGSATARLYAHEGSDVCIADVSGERAEVVAKEIVDAGGRATSTVLDVSQSASWENAVSATEEAFGHLDIMVNLSGNNYRVSFDDQTEEMWRRMIDVNLTGCFLGIKAVVPAMRRTGRGVILHVGSLASIRQGAGSPAYGVSKIGLVALTRSAARAYAGDKIRCVLISPGHVDTNFIRNDSEHSPNSWETSIDNPENYERRKASTPLGRLCEPEDIAKTFLFAATEEAAMITGSMITVDGGAGM